MLKYFLSISLLFGAFSHASTTFYTEPVGETAMVSANVPIKEGNMLVLSDEGIWAIFPVKSSYSLVDRFKEWWTSSQIEQPEENFLFEFSSWKPGVNIQPHLLNWNSNTTEDMKKYHQSRLKECTHILENVQTNEWAFARKLTMAETINMFQKHAEEMYAEGHSKGYRKGKEEGYWKGHADGRVKGHSEGKEEGFTEGSDVGYDEGYKVGYPDGHEEGYKLGYGDGYIKAQEDMEGFGKY